jgi:hypothetical protein
MLIRDLAPARAGRDLAPGQRPDLAAELAVTWQRPTRIEPGAYVALRIDSAELILYHARARGRARAHARDYVPKQYIYSSYTCMQ